MFIFEIMGKKFQGFITELGEITILVWQVVVLTVKAPFERRNIFSQLDKVGVQSLSVVAIVGAFTGMVLVVQTYYQLHKLSAETVAGAIVGLSITRELGPVLTGLMLAGRVGAAFTAEIGTMKVTEQVDALHTLATNPIKYLVVPRFVACILLVPVLTVFADFIGILGGYIVGVDVLGINSSFYLTNMKRYLELIDIMGGLAKSCVFGMIIAIIGCYKGLSTKGGAEGVGKATTSAVVTSYILIIVADFFISVVYNILGI